MSMAQTCRAHHDLGDCAADFRTMLAGLRHSGQTLYLEKGTYLFEESDAAVKAFFDLSGLADFTLDGRGSTLLFRGECKPFLLQGCAGVEIKNLSCIQIAETKKCSQPTLFTIENSTGVTLKNVSMVHHGDEPAVSAYATPDFEGRGEPLFFHKVIFRCQDGCAVSLWSQSASFAQCTFSAPKEAVLLQTDFDSGAGITVERCVFRECALSEEAQAQICVLPAAEADVRRCFSSVILLENRFHGSRKAALIARQARGVQLMDNIARPVMERDYFQVSEYDFYQRLAHI